MERAISPLHARLLQCSCPHPALSSGNYPHNCHLITGVRFIKCLQFVLLNGFDFCVLCAKCVSWSLDYLTYEVNIAPLTYTFTHKLGFVSFSCGISGWVNLLEAFSVQMKDAQT